MQEHARVVNGIHHLAVVVDHDHVTAVMIQALALDEVGRLGIDDDQQCSPPRQHETAVGIDEHILAITAKLFDHVARHGAFDIGDDMTGLVELFGDQRIHTCRGADTIQIGEAVPRDQHTVAQLDRLSDLL